MKANTYIVQMIGIDFLQLIRAISVRLTLLIVLLSNINKAEAQVYTGPIPKPTQGYGSEGIYTVAVESFSNPNFPSQSIRIYHPTEITEPLPTLFYSHGFGGNNPSFNQGLLNFFAQKGYVIVFVPYQTLGVSNAERYQNLLEGFRKAARDYPSIIDTTRVGFLGHSFGGGACIPIAHRCFSENNWGVNGRFVSPSAQWYSLELSQQQLSSFPPDTKLLSFIYEDDVVNDHRMACEIFRNINIDVQEKDFITVFPASVAGYDYTAGHDLPSTNAAFDAMDFYAYYRLLDALCDYTFNGNAAGKLVALGNGSSDQITMPEGMANLVQSDFPIAQHPESAYSFPCSDALNPRQAFCNSIVTSSNTPINARHVSVFPNPSQESITIKSDRKMTSVELISAEGKVIQKINVSEPQCLVPLTGLTSGSYFIRVHFKFGPCWVSQVIKQ